MIPIDLLSIMGASVLPRTESADGANLPVEYAGPEAVRADTAPPSWSWLGPGGHWFFSPPFHQTSPISSVQKTEYM